MSTKYSQIATGAGPRPGWHRLMQVIGPMVSVFGAIITLIFGLANDPAIPIWVMLVGVLVGISIVSAGIALFRQFGGKLPWEDEYSDTIG